MSDNHKRNPEDNTDTETIRATTHLGVGPETGLHPSDTTPEEPHYDTDVARDPDSPPADDRIAQRPTWLLLALAIFIGIILFFLWR